MAWSYCYTARSQVDSGNTIEVSINILEDGVARIENIILSGSPSQIASICESKVTAFSAEYGSYTALPEIGEVVPVIE